MLNSTCVFRQLSLQAYQPVWQAMQAFTLSRDSQTKDEIWFVEHLPVFTQGQAGKEEHLLQPGDIPVVQVDRGGQVTYHGPGQQVVYFLLDLKRKKMGVRELVTCIEQTVIDLLETYNIKANARADAPGVYVDDMKVCSLGLKVKRGCSFHGLALNVAMDKQPFERINPCGYAGMAITQLSELNGPSQLSEIEAAFKQVILSNLHVDAFEHKAPPNLS
jgi:lipoyl(octanoyl) transferase